MMMNRHTLQQQPVAVADLAEPVSMKEWTGGAIDSLSSKSNESKHPSKDKIVCSRAYMSCALKIAHSLADQLSTVEEERRDLLLQDSNGNNNIPLLVDTIDNNKSWSEYISVYCMKRSVDEKKGEISVNNDKGDNVEGASIDIDADIQPLPFNFYGGGGDNSEQPEELQNLEHRLSTLFDINNVNQSIDYLNVRGAILNEKAADGKLFHSANGTLEIRSLGIAFYELFSGGQITTTAEAGVPQQPRYPTQSPSLHNVGQTAPELYEHPGESELINTIGGPSKRMCQSNISLGKSSQKTISVEPLKLLGLPTSLCDLISNMIESGNGDTHGGIGEAYEFVSEVRDDLKLMIDSPNIYFEDIDLAKATNVGLQFGSSLHGREAEMQALKESCQRSISTGCEVAMICGTSGIGKSKLSEEFARSAKESGSIFISGRCDKLQSQPLKPISSAYNKYCAWLSVNDRSTAEKIAAALKEYLGEDLASLVSAMPNLANILGDDFDSTENENDTAAMDSQKRLRYLFCVFTGVISSCHDTPLIFFLDDCQWMDSATVALLNQIMIMTGVDIEDNGFFFGCYRDDEMGETHPLFQMLSTVNSLCGTKTTKIHLTPMSKGDLNEMVSATLNLLPRITRPLADMLHHRTKGSPLFVKQVMMDLYKQRLLYPSLSRRRWVWEFDKILEMKIPENVAAFITKSFDRLPSEVLSALVVLSCFGASADISLIEVLEREIQQPLIAPLDVAVAHSVLGKRNGEFYFMHDKLQEAAYSMMKAEERCLHHNRYGLALGFVAEREKDDKMLLTAVGQINHGGSQVVIDDEQAIVVANLNLDAGMKAMIMSDFFLAHSFFNHGMSYLRRGHWTEHYDLSLQLFNLAAKCALLNADHESLQALIDQIMQNAKCFEDKTQAISNRVTLLTWSGNVLGAVELVNSTLSRLGEGFPAKITSSVIKTNLDNTKAQLASLSDDTLLSYPAMVNPSKILALQLFSKHFQILPLVHQTALMPLIPLKIIQISLAYGMSPRSPIGFAQYGNFLALVRDEFEEGYRYVKFALSLMKKIPSRAYVGSVMFHANYTKVHVEPMQSVIECYLDAYFASMKSGNPYAIGCSYVYNTFCFWSGKELKAVVSSMKETLMESKYQKNLLVRALMLPTFRMVLRLMGQSSAPQQDHDINTSAEARNEDDIKQVLHLRAVFFVRLSEALIFRELDEARDAAKEYFSIGEVGCKFAVTTIPLFFMRLYSGLVSFWIGREINDKKKESMKWLARGVACKDEIEKLAASASKWNFQNKVYLLQAEEQFCRMNFEEAEKLYDAAILTSKVHKFLNEEALANELAGHFYLETGRRDRSVHYFSQAFEKYNEWGAAAKANMLTKYLDGR